MENKNTVKAFYDTYTPTARRYGLRLSAKFSRRENYVRIYSCATGKTVVKVEDEDEAGCFQRATEELKHWQQRKEEKKESKKSNGVFKVIAWLALIGLFLTYAAAVGAGLYGYL